MEEPNNVVEAIETLAYYKYIEENIHWYNRFYTPIMAIIAIGIALLFISTFFAVWFVDWWWKITISDLGVLLLWHFVDKLVDFWLESKYEMYQANKSN